LSESQKARISPHFPLAHGVPRIDERRVVCGMIYVIKYGLQWKDALPFFTMEQLSHDCFQAVETIKARRAHKLKEAC
jgi:transposase